MLSAESQRHESFAAEIMAIHQCSKGAYGALRITAELVARGQSVNHNTYVFFIADLGLG